MLEFADPYGLMFFFLSLNQVFYTQNKCKCEIEEERERCNGHEMALTGLPGVQGSVVKKERC